MNIIRLEASNFKKLTAISITPDGNVITLTGQNGAGKSSVLDAIMAALAGTKNIPDEPIRRGQESGEITLELDNGYRIVRRFTAKTSTLTIQNAQGRIGSPQAMLDTLLGNLAFDPLAFSRLKAAAQWEQLRELVGLDFKELESKRQKAYDDRTVINREIDRMLTLTKEIPPSVEDIIPDAELSLGGLLAEISEALDFNVAIDNADSTNARLRADWERAQNICDITQQEIVKLQLRLKTEQEALAAANNAWHKNAITEIPAKRDVSALQAKLAGIEDANKGIRAKIERRKLTASTKIEVAKSAALSQEIENLDAEKKQRIADAKFPLSELSFNGSEITYKGIAFAQASDGEKLRVSVAVGMALNPKLRVIFVRDGSLLDKAGLQTIADLATTNNYQVWLEDARSTDPSAIEISDGAIV